MAPKKPKKLENELIELAPGGRKVNGVFEPSVTAADLVAPPSAPKFTEPRVPSINSGVTGRVSNMSNEVGGIIEANTKEAERLRELREEQAVLGVDSAAMYRDELDRGGVNENLSELKDIQLQLTDMQTASDLRKSRISGAPGQTLNQGLAELTQEDREEAVRQTGLAARAAVLTDNINTARTLAKDAVDLAFQDAQFNLSNLQSQITDLGGVVDSQTSQLVAQKMMRLEEVKSAVQSAILAGATQSQIDTMLSLTVPEEQRFALAQSIIGAKARAPGKRDTQVVELNGRKVLIDSQTGEVISDFAGDGGATDTLALAVGQQNIDTINNVLHSGALSSAVGPSGLAQTSPGLWGATKRFISGALAGAAVGGGAGAAAGGVGAIPGAIVGALSLGVINSVRGTTDELTGDRQNFVAGVEQLRSQLTLDKLTQSKQSGATFGALSDGERQTLAAAATKLGTWAIKSGDRVIGYNTSEEAFKKEMDTINNFAKLDQILKGAAPESVGALAQPDGSIWVINSDGSMTRIR